MAAPIAHPDRWANTCSRSQPHWRQIRASQEEHNSLENGKDALHKLPPSLLLCSSARENLTFDLFCSYRRVPSSLILQSSTIILLSYSIYWTSDITDRSFHSWRTPDGHFFFPNSVFKSRNIVYDTKLSNAYNLFLRRGNIFPCSIKGEILQIARTG